jgi:hypothetical protein
MPPASPEQAEAEAADRHAIAAEPPLPDPGTPERDRVDRQHAETVAGSCWALSGTGWTRTAG